MRLESCSVDIYTDGSCYKGVGGWAYAMLFPDRVVTSYGGAYNTTVNQMEQMAAIMALQAMPFYEGVYCNRCLKFKKNFGSKNIFDYPASCDLKCIDTDYCEPRLTGFDTIRLFTDSQYLSKGMDEHIYHWSLDKFKTRDGGEVLNQFFWNELLKLNKIFSPDWNWVKGHSGVEYNEVVDVLAGTGRKSAKDYLSKVSKKELAGLKNSSPIYNFDGLRYASLDSVCFNSVADFKVIGSLQQRVVYTKNSFFS